MSQHITGPIKAGDVLRHGLLYSSPPSGTLLKLESERTRMRKRTTNKMYEMDEVIRLTGLPRSSAYLLLKEGLPHYRWGRSIRVAESDLEAFIAAHRVTPTSQRADEPAFDARVGASRETRASRL